MSGTVGVLAGLVLLAVGLGGLGFGLYEMMTQTTPDAAKAIGGLAAYVVAALASLAAIR